MLESVGIFLWYNLFMAKHFKVFSSSTPNWEDFYHQRKSEILEDDLPEHEDMDDHDDEDWEPPKWNMLK
jgi:hypothetical protein